MAYAVLVISAPKQKINTLLIQSRQDWNTPLNHLLLRIFGRLVYICTISAIPRITKGAPPDPVSPNQPRLLNLPCANFSVKKLLTPNIEWGCPSLTDGGLLARKEKDSSWYLAQLSGL